MISKTLFAVTLSLCVALGVTDPVLIQSRLLERVTEGDTVRLQCTMWNAVVGSTDVFWYQEQQVRWWVLTHASYGSIQRSSRFTDRFQSSRDTSSNSFILTITNVQPSDTAVYYCLVWGWIYSTGTQLIVTSTTGPVLIQSPKLERVTEGHTARLQCTMSNAAVRDTDVHWYQQQLGNHMHWVLTHEARGHTRRNRGFTDRFQSSRAISSNSFILTITNIQPSDTAIYYCTVRRTSCGTGSQLIITSTTVPLLAQSPSLECVTEGHTARLQCTMRNAAVRDTDILWYRVLPGQKMEWVLTHASYGSIRQSPGFTDRFQPSRDTSSNSFILTITNVQPSDTAVYYCKLQGKTHGTGTELNVTSADVPVLIQSPTLGRVTEGHTARLQCTMWNAAVRDTDVHWYRELPGQDMEWILTHDIMNSTRRSPGFTDRFQSSRDTSNNSFILTISNVQPSDTAVYYCKVWGDISGNGIQLNVTSPLADPVLIQYPMVSKVPEGETVELQCAMYNASVNDTDVHWHYQRLGNESEWLLSQFVNGTITRSRGFHNRFQPSRNITSNSYILTIVNVNLNDTATYSCSVWSYIYGAGTELNVTKGSSSDNPWMSNLLVISMGTILGFVVLFCIALVIFFLIKQKMCSTKNSSQGTPDEDPNTVYAMVDVHTRTSNPAAASPVMLDEGEGHYAELQLTQQGTVQPTVTVTESTTEYAVVRRI